MQPYTASEIREKFLDFFQRQGHRQVASAPLVPQDDPSLLFTNAGMVPFKDIFTGKTKAPYTRAVSVQKCIRAGGKHNDLENVGRTARHHTFFEMLGNFSFGDYFKRDAIAYAWEFLTQELQLPAERIWVTVYRDDEEAFRLWKEIAGLPGERIIRLGEKDNFWSMGDTGPCGPCSELIFDRGEEARCDQPECALGVCDCDRWREVWNLVFMQYERRPDGSLHSLPKPSIDTGMGLERLASILQNVASNYDTDLFQPILESISRLSGRAYDSGEAGFPFRVIADHIRSCTFLISEGIVPGNEGRNYVLRRILRRAARFGRVLGIDPPFLHKLVPAVTGKMGASYPELPEQEQFIQQVMETEEKRFHETLDQGLGLLGDMLDDLHRSGKRVLPGEACFQLYDTFGLPVDLLADVCDERGFGVDREGFEKRMEVQRQRARADRAEKSGDGLDIAVDDLEDLPPTEFTGYEGESDHGRLLAIFRSDGDSYSRADSASGGDRCWIVLDKTPFYGESGGQIGDTGQMSLEGSHIEVEDTRRLGSLTLHRCRLRQGGVRVGDRLLAVIDKDRRDDIRRNHSATHLLHSALRKVLGEHVKQSGSRVEPNRLRFDFTHFQPLTPEELVEIERRVNQEILRGMDVTTTVTDLETARAMGAMALFQERYGERVRLVSMGDFSLELCGGTHVRNTGQIGMFKIVDEQGIAAGVRRIEAVTGMEVLSLLQDLEMRLDELCALLKAQPENISKRVEDLLMRLEETERVQERILLQQSLAEAENLLENAEQRDGIRLITGEIPGGSSEVLREVGDRLRSRIDPAVVILGTRNQGKASFIVMASREAVQKGVHAGKAVAEAARIAGGGGGGRPDMAQAGGKKSEMLAEALEAARQKVVQQLEQSGV